MPGEVEVQALRHGSSPLVAFAPPPMACPALPTGGANSVSIDNKINQAMDLVKMHLMYAVKEEISALKDKVEDLEQKVYRLEWENRILREHADVETMALIQVPQQAMLNGPVGGQENVALPAAPEAAASS